VIALFGFNSQLSSAEPSVRFLIRWAAHSAFSSVHGIPQTFSPVEQRRAQRQVLDPLGGPLRLQLGARDTPDLLRVRLEEDPEQATAEPVGHPVLERIDLPVGEQPPPDVAEHDQHPLDGPQLGQRLEGLERVVEELLVVEDAGHPRAPQEVLPQDPMPQLADFVRLGEEPVASHVEPVALVGLGPGDPAHQVRTLEHDRAMTVFDQFQGRRQPRGAGTDHDHVPTVSCVFHGFWPGAWDSNVIGRGTRPRTGRSEWRVIPHLQSTPQIRKSAAPNQPCLFGNPFFAEAGRTNDP
jgi:hypothetical protein